MKYGIGIIVVGLFVSSSVLAGNLPSVPNEFSSGTAAKASEVNANFEAVRAEVDDNATTIGTKQTAVINTCGANQTIRLINADGSVTCKNDIDTNTHLEGVEYANASTYLNVNATASVPETKASVAVTVPTAGYIIASYTAHTKINHNTGTSHYVRVALSTSASGSVSGPSFRYTFTTSALPSGLYYNAVATQDVFQVSAGTTTIYLRADSDIAGSNAQLGFGNLTAIFVPNKY